MIKSFSDFLVEETKEVVFTFGRFNPPTVGHEKLITKVASLAKGNNYRIYASQSQDPKKNPLDFATKVKVMRKMFPKHGRAIMADKGIRNAMDILVKLYDQGFTKVTMVVGSDRVNEFSALTNKYNGVSARHGLYNFEDGVNVVSAGERDPDAEGVEGMSASKMRAAAADNDFSSFSKGLPTGFKGGKELFDALRKAMGIKEAAEYKNHFQFEPVSDIRESYIKKDLFEVGEQVALPNHNNIVGEITYLGANYLIVESKGETWRCWLSDVQKINPDHEETVSVAPHSLEKPAYLSEAKDSRDKKNDDDERKKTSYQDKDVDEIPGSQPKRFYSGLDKKDKEKRARQFNRQAKMADDDPKAYKPAPGDKETKTKPSQFTKKFKQMYGEAKDSGIETTLRKKADQTGMPYAILKKVFDRGVAAWKVGHRPGTTPAQWGMARVNSFATKSPKTWGKYDSDLAAKVRGN